MLDESDHLSRDPVAAPAGADVRWKLLAEMVRRGDYAAVDRIISSGKERPGADWLAYWSRISLPEFPDTAHLLADYALEADIASPEAHIAKAHACAATSEHAEAAEHYALAQAIDPEIWDPTFDSSAEPERTPYEDSIPPSGELEPENEIQPEPQCESEPNVEFDDHEEFENADGPEESGDQNDTDQSSELPGELHLLPPVESLELKPHWNLTSALQITTLPPLVAPESIPRQHLPAFQKSASIPAQLKLAGSDTPPVQTQRVLALPKPVPESHPTLPGEGEIERFPGDFHPDDVVLLVADSGVIPKLPVKSLTQERISATLVTILVHIAIFTILAFIIISIPDNEPPEIIATTSSQTKTDAVRKRLPRAVSSNPSPPSQSNLAVIAAAATSQVVAPTVEFDVTADNLDLGSSFGAGSAFGGGTGSGGAFGVPAAMKSRCSAEERNKMLAEHGGGRGSELAIVRALNWISRQQNEDGSWGKKYKCAMTGLSLLAFLGHCETPDSERYGSRVMRGILYLVEVSQKNSVFATAPGHSSAYEHGIATYALGESYAIARLGTRKLPGMREAFVKGTTTIINGQNPDGGWSYEYPKSGASDISVTGWQYQALKAAKHTKIKIEGLDASIQKAQAFLANVQDRNSGGFPYRPGEPGKRTLSAAGVLGLQMLGGEEQYADNIERGLRFALGDLHEQNWRNANIYTWYYNTQACFQYGGNPWDHWNKMFSNSLTLNQSFDGAWDGAAGAQAGPDAHFYTTCLAVLMLEVYYRYLPTSG